MVKCRCALNVRSQPTDISIRNSLVVNAALLGDLTNYPNPHSTKWLGLIWPVATTDAGKNLKNILNFLTHRNDLPKPPNAGVKRRRSRPP